MWSERTLEISMWIGITYGLAVLVTGIFLWIRANPTVRSCFESLLMSTWTILGFVSIPAGFGMAIPLSPRDNPLAPFLAMFFLFGGGLGIALIGGARRRQQ